MPSGGQHYCDRFLLQPVAPTAPFPSKASGQPGPRTCLASLIWEIKIGQTIAPRRSHTPLRGGRPRGAAYFKMINYQGGNNGRNLNLVSFDHGYSPPKRVRMRGDD